MLSISEKDLANNHTLFHQQAVVQSMLKNRVMEIIVIIPLNQIPKIELQI